MKLVQKYPNQLKIMYQQDQTNDLDGDVSSFVDFESLKQEDGLESIIGIAEAGYTDDVVQLKKDSRRFQKKHDIP